MWDVYGKTVLHCAVASNNTKAIKATFNIHTESEQVQILTVRHNRGDMSQPILNEAACSNNIKN